MTPRRWYTQNVLPSRQEPIIAHKPEMSIYGIDSIKYQRPINRNHLRVWWYHRNRMATPRRPLTGSSVRCWYRVLYNVAKSKVSSCSILIIIIYSWQNLFIFLVVILDLMCSLRLPEPENYQNCYGHLILWLQNIRHGNNGTPCFLPTV